MKRVIKFRMYRDGKMQEVHQLNAYGDVGSYQFNSPEDNGEFIMQFTGLHDKNGKEIYEGDICTIDLRKSSGHQIDKDNSIVGVVEFGRICVNDNSLHVFDAFHIKNRSLHYLMYNNLKVMGNIYENPELLHP